MRMLVVEDDAAIGHAVRATLEQAGHAVDQLVDGERAVTALQRHSYALVVLDLGLPGCDGESILHSLRAQHDNVPVLVITAREDVASRVRTLDLGADDYLVKPFSLAELDARVRALLRRRRNEGLPTRKLGQLAVDLSGHRVLHRGQPLELTAREFGVLEVLAVHVNRVVSRQQLVEALCGWGEQLSDNSIDITIHRLRTKLDGAGVTLRTVRGLGYLLEARDDGA